MNPVEVVIKKQIVAYLKQDKKTRDGLNLINVRTYLQEIEFATGYIRGYCNSTGFIIHSHKFITDIIKEVYE